SLKWFLVEYFQQLLQLHPWRCSLLVAEMGRLPKATNRRKKTSRRISSLPRVVRLAFTTPSAVSLQPSTKIKSMMSRWTTLNLGAQQKASGRLLHGKGNGNLALAITEQRT